MILCFRVESKKYIMNQYKKAEVGNSHVKVSYLSLNDLSKLFPLFQDIYLFIYLLSENC